MTNLSFDLEKERNKGKRRIIKKIKMFERKENGEKLGLCLVARVSMNE